MIGRGFRAMARTILDEVLKVRPDCIEHQLAPAVRDPNGRAYNRTAYLPERREMMHAWADYLDGLKNGAQVVPLTKNGSSPSRVVQVHGLHTRTNTAPRKPTSYQYCLEGTQGDTEE